MTDDQIEGLLKHGYVVRPTHDSGWVIQFRAVEDPSFQPNMDIACAFTSANELTNFLIRLHNQK